MDLQEQFPPNLTLPPSASRPLKNLPRRTTIPHPHPKHKDSDFVIDLTLPSPTGSPSNNEVLELTDSDTEMADNTADLKTTYLPLYGKATDPDLDCMMGEPLGKAGPSTSSTRLSTKTPNPPHYRTTIDPDLGSRMGETLGKAGPSNGPNSSSHLSTKSLSPDHGPMPYIFHTNDTLATRQTLRTWTGTHRAEDWVPSREDLHAEEVDRSRILPLQILERGYPHFVGFILTLLIFSDSFRPYLI